MTTITPEPTVVPANTQHVFSPRAHRTGQRSSFSEVREQARQRALMITATTTAIFSVTAAAAAAVMLGLGS